MAAGEATAACFATGSCAAIVAGAATGVAGNEVINQAKKKADETGAPNKTELPIADKDPTGGKLVNPAAEEKKDPTLSAPDQSEAQGATHTGNTEGNPDTGGNTTSTPVADEPSKDDLAYTAEGYQPNKGAVGNMGEFFNQPGFGEQTKNNSQKTSKQYQGQSVYKANQPIGDYIRRGDQFYLDAKHKDHIEVFDSTGTKVQAVLNLDGSFNRNKTEAAIKEGRRLPK